jgi:hypothetical protein
MMINIKGLSKGAVLAALYNASRPIGLGILYTNDVMTEKEGSNVYAEFGPSFDYIKGRVMKVNLGNDEFDPWLYDRDNGKGAADKVISALRDDHDGR